MFRSCNCEAVAGFGGIEQALPAGLILLQQRPAGLEGHDARGREIVAIGVGEHLHERLGDAELLDIARKRGVEVEGDAAGVIEAEFGRRRAAEGMAEDAEARKIQPARKLAGAGRQLREFVDDEGGVLRPVLDTIVGRLG